MQKFKTLKKYEDKIQFITGFTQLTLNKEIPALWVFAVVYHAIQKLAIIKLSHQMASLLNGQRYYMSGPLHMLFKVSVPFIFLIETLSIQYLMAIQIALIVLLTLPMSHVTMEMLTEKQLYRNQKFRNKNDLQILQSDNLTDYILLMNQIYNQNCYLEGFQHKLIQNSQTILTVRLRQIAIILNYFPQFFFLPLTYFNMELQIMVKKDPQYEVPVTILNLILFLQNMVITFISFNYTQQSYTTNDCNNLQIKQSILTKIHFILNFLPILISYIITASESYDLMQSQLFDGIIVGMIFLSQWVIALERYKCIPFVTQFKIITNLIVYSFVICIATFVLFQYDDQQVITLTLIAFPPLARISILTGQWRVEEILTTTLRKEKQIIPQKDTIQLRLEVENQKHRDQQSQALYGINQTFFIHFLRSIEQMQLNQVGVLTRNSQIKLINLRSRLLLVCKILFKTHRENCYNPYCFCRGINSERRRCIEKYEIVKEMRMYDDFRIHNIQFYIEFIMRYIRDYCKVVFQMEMKKQSSNFLYLIQLLSFICQSDECYQAQLLILQLKQKMDKVGTQLKERMALQLLFSLNKYQILLRMNLKVTRQQVENTLQYEDFRITEIKRDEILKRIFKNIEIKINFLKQLNTDNHSYTSLENLFIETVEEKQKTDEMIISFNKQSHSKTSLYCDMFYCLEVSNNYDLFVKLYQSMNQRESKFFEHPSFYFNTESSAFKVAYLLINLTQNLNNKRGDIICNSKNTGELLKFNQIDSKQLKQLDQLLVPSMINAHDEMLEIFVLTSRPALFRESRSIICQTQEQGIIVYINMFIDISFQFNNNTLPCYAFIRQVKEGIGLDEIKGVIYMNQNLIIEGITQTALQLLKLEQNILYKQDGRQVFPEIHIVLDEFEEELQQYFINNPVEDETEQTLTTHEKLIQKYSKFIDSAKMVINDSEFQIDMEVKMSYSKVNQIVYKSYLILIKNIYKMIHNPSLDSPIHKSSMNELKSSSNVRIRLRKYNTEMPFVLMTKEDQTQRSQFNQSEHEIMPLNEQQDFLNSEFRQKSESEQPEQHSKEQKENYINSVSSGSTRISEIQKILIKSNFYSHFSSMKSQPHLLILILILNITSFAFIILSASIYITQYDQWQMSTTDNLEILQAFIMRSYSRGTQQGEAILLYTLYEFSPKSLEAELQSEIEYDEDKVEKLKLILNYNIFQFTDLMDIYQENMLIRGLFSRIQLKQLDVFTSEIKVVDGWTALFQLIYMIQNLKIIENDNYFESSKSLVYLIQSYKQYKDAYGQLQKQLNLELQNILDQYNQVIINLRALNISFLFIILMISFCVNYSYFQLVKKYLRCCEQISHQSITEEQNYLQGLLQEQDQFDLYEQTFSIKDKFNIELASSNHGKKRNGSVYKQFDVNNNQSSKKYISIQNQTNYKRKMYFLLENISYVIFFIFYIVQSLQDQSQISNLKTNIVTYQRFISLTEAVAETCMTNYILQTQDLLIEFNIINITQTQEFATYSNDSYYSANQMLSQMFIQNPQLQDGVQQLSVGNVCQQLDHQVNLCESLDNGILTQGILKPISILLSVVRDNLQTYYQNGKAQELFQLEDILIQNYVIEAIFAFVNTIRTQIQDDLAQQNQKNLIIWLIFYILLIIINTIQIYKTHKYKYDKIYKIRQQVFLLPPSSLYMEESYFKTLSFMTKIENKFIHI